MAYQGASKVLLTPIQLGVHGEGGLGVAVFHDPNVIKEFGRRSANVVEVHVRRVVYLGHH